MPARLAPMLAEIGGRPHTDHKYLYEPKLDGYRALAFIRDETVRLQSRRGIDLTAPFPEIVTELQAQAVDGMILDGEIVALGVDGRPSFNALQNRAGLKSAKEIAQAQEKVPVVFMCFDLLHFAGVNLRQSPYVDRRRYLAQCLLPGSHLQLVHAAEDAEAMYAAALESGFEGIVARRKDSQYQPGRRSAAWQKVKAVKSAEFVVGGFTQGQGVRESLGALLLGYWQGDALRFAGHVGSGLDDAGVARLAKRFADLKTRKRPFAEEPPLHRPTTWLKPELVAEVKFSGWTPDGYLRAPVFLRMRDDITAADVRAGPDAGEPDAQVETAAEPRTTAKSSSDPDEVLAQLDQKGNRLDLQVGSARIRLTNLDREYWPGGARNRPPPITKRDLLRYLTRASPCLLTHLRNRPLTMIRMPEGIGGERFFQ